MARMDEIAALIEPHVLALRRYAYGLLRDPHAADDLVQDCLERALSRWPLRRRESDLRAWLVAILRTHFLTGLRQRTRRGAHVGIDDLHVQPSVEPDQEWRAGHRDLLAGLDSLPEEQRSVLLLVGVEDFTYEAAARVLGVPIGTVMSRLSRGRWRLRRFLDGGQSAPRTPLRSVK